MSESCRTCRHWTPPEGADWSPIERHFGRCARTPHSEGMCGWSDDCCTERVIRAEFADRTALVEDGSGYYAVLLTKAEHFCSMHQPEEPA